MRVTVYPVIMALLDTLGTPGTSEIHEQYAYIRMNVCVFVCVYMCIHIQAFVI